MIATTGTADQILPEAITYLETLFTATDLVTFRPVETWTGPDNKKESRVIYSQILTAPQRHWCDGLIVEKVCSLEAEHGNAFVGVCPRQPGGGSFELAWQIGTVRALWSDVDACTVDEALERITKADLPEPSMIVSSGNGGHFYWLLNEAIQTGAPDFGVFQQWGEHKGKRRPRRFYNDGEQVVWLDDEKFNSVRAAHPPLTETAVKIQDVLSGIAAKIGGDHTTDLSRLLRLPGTMNRKNGRNGSVAKPCRLIHADKSKRYDYSDFLRLSSESPAKKQREQIASVRLPPERKLSPAKQQILDGKLFQCENAEDRSTADYALCAWAIEKGVAKDDVWSQCRDIGKFAERGEPYFERTWSRAAQCVREDIYSRLTSQHEHRVTRTVSTVSDIPPDEPVKIGRSYDSDNLNDIGNAEHFVDTFGAEFRYVGAWSKWLVWDGKRWRIDDDQRPMKRAKELVLSMFADAMEIRGEDVHKHVRESAKLSRLRAMIDLAAPELPVSVKELDADPWILNCHNGVVDLMTGNLLPHRPQDFQTKLCPTVFDLDAESDTWMSFLLDVFQDAELIDFLQRWFGYCLTGVVTEQRLPIFHGNGANGKSTLLNAFLDTIGPDYSMQCLPDFLMEKKGESHPTEKASLFGKRFVSCTETESSRRLAESTVKMLTGGEKIMARRMREDFWEFDPSHKLVLCTNHKPVVRGTDHGIWRRLLLVPFNQRFEGSRQDKNLPAKLKAEQAGILAWAVRGCLEWQTHGLNPPESVTAATNDYRSSEDVLGRFVSDCCVTSQAITTKFGALYDRFEQWCEDGGEPRLTKRAVGSWLKDNGYEEFSANGRHYRGIALRSEAAMERTE